MTGLLDRWYDVARGSRRRIVLVGRDIGSVAESGHPPAMELIEDLAAVTEDRGPVARLTGTTR